jgi:single-stranded DNA-specific DHH superfamily exonuclease
VRARRYQALIANLTIESWDALLARMATELTPLNTEKIKAFATRNAEAMKQVEAEEAKPTAPSEQKAEFLYRVIMGPGIAGVARSRLNLELKDKLLTLAMRKGTTLKETDFADLRTADGKPLKFGQYEGVKAIVAPDIYGPLLVIGPVK